MKKFIVLVLVVGLAAGGVAGFNTLRGSDAKDKEVLSDATERFKFELHDCLVYNQQLYEHDKQKIQRGDPGTSGNPQEPRLNELEEWYAFEQETCQKAYEDKLDYWQKSR